MPDPSYLTDADRACRPEPMRKAYRFWLVFTLRGTTTYRRYFRSAEDRTAYVHQLLKGHTNIETGEDT